MTTLKDQLDEAKQKLYEDVSAAIERYQAATGLSVQTVRYKDNTYASFPKTNFYGFALCVDVGNSL
jgi:hypothetical protein